MTAPDTARTLNDIVLFTSLIYWVVETQDDPPDFSSCAWPVQTWLLVSYGFVIGCRVLSIVGARSISKEPEEFLLDFRHCDMIPRILAGALWIFVLPCFTAWNILGSYWIVSSKIHSSQCLPANVTSFFVVAWHMLCYAAILLLISTGCLASMRERRLRLAEADLRQVENEDMRSRWGDVSRLSSYSALPDRFGPLLALTPADIHTLPIKSAGSAGVGQESECAICLEAFAPQERVRQLGVCGHTFHQSCIDLWLLRCAHCPLCKRDVRASEV